MTYTGAHLENEGEEESAGSHFEKLHYGNELMTSKLTGRPLISGFTKNMLEDSGWYLVSAHIQENLTWGKEKGCSFLNDKCDDMFKEFCLKEKQINCTVDFSGKTYCKVRIISIPIWGDSYRHEKLSISSNSCSYNSVNLES